MSAQGTWLCLKSRERARTLSFPPVRTARSSAEARPACPFPEGNSDRRVRKQVGKLAACNCTLSTLPRARPRTANPTPRSATSGRRPALHKRADGTSQPCMGFWKLASWSERALKSPLRSTSPSHLTAIAATRAPLPIMPHTARAPAVHSDSPLDCEVTLVADEDHRDALPAGVVEDLLADDGAHLERAPRADAVHEDPPVEADRVPRGEDRELVLQRAPGQHAPAAKARGDERRTWPAVSMMSRLKSCPLYLTTFWNVFSIVG